MPENTLDIEFWILAGVVAAPILLGLFVRLCMFLSEFAQERRYINCEIQRSSGSERRFWIRQRKRLWLSLIPFIKHR